VSRVHYDMNFIVGYVDEAGEHLGHWSEMRYDNVIRLRQEALDLARHRWSDYLLVSRNDYTSYIHHSQHVCH